MRFLVSFFFVSLTASVVAAPDSVPLEARLADYAVQKFGYAPAVQAEQNFARMPYGEELWDISPSSPVVVVRPTQGVPDVTQKWLTSYDHVPVNGITSITDKSGEHEILYLGRYQGGYAFADAKAGE